MTTQALDYSAEELGRHGLRLEAQVVECLRALAAGDRDGILASLRRLKLETAATRRVVRAAFADAVADGPLELATPVTEEPAAALRVASSGTPAAQANGRSRRSSAAGDAQRLASVSAERLAVEPSESPSARRPAEPQPSHLHRLTERDPLTLPAGVGAGQPAVGAPRTLTLPRSAAPASVQAEVLRLVAAQPGRLTPDDLHEYQQPALRYAGGYLADTAAQLVAAGRLRLEDGRLLPVG